MAATTSTQQATAALGSTVRRLSRRGRRTPSSLGSHIHLARGKRLADTAKGSLCRAKGCVVTRAAAGSDGGGGGGGGELNTNILYERMKALQAKEAAVNSAVEEAAIEQDQAIVAGIRGDAAERPAPSGEGEEGEREDPIQ